MITIGRRIEVRGIVQGVGFRPWIYKLAHEGGVTGRVRNDAGGVIIDVFGSASALEGFSRNLLEAPPPAAEIADVSWHDIPAEPLDTFTITGSASSEALRVSIPSDRSFAEYDTALAHLHAAPLPAGLDLPWQQALLDVELEAPIESPTSLFSIRARTERLGMRVVNAVRFFGANGVERVFQIEGDAGVVRLDPRWHQSLLR